MRVHLDMLKQLTEAEGRDFSALTINLFPAVGSWQNRRIRANAMG
jgi:hypothetical protein